MCTTKRSPTACTGSPVASISMPELSIVTCPRGSQSTAKICAGGAAIVRWTSSRSVVTLACCHVTETLAVVAPRRLEEGTHGGHGGAAGMQRTRMRRSTITRGIALAAVMAVALAGCDWSMFHGGPERPGYNPESTIANDSRASLSTLFTAGQTDAIESSPAGADGVGYGGGGDKPPPA